VSASVVVRVEIYSDLERIVGAANVTANSAALASAGVRVDRADAPAWLIRPGSAAEVSELMRLASERRIIVVPIGAATRATGRGVADRSCIYIDLKRMDHVLHLDETSLVVHAQAGLTALALETILAPRGLSLGDYPPGALRSTIGGLLAVRTPGKASRRHGFIEDAVLGVSAVLADGRTIHTRVAPRRATGPDLARVLCGSEGTLGIITSAVLRIHRRPEARLLAAHALPSFEDALGAVNLALREEAAPAALRIYDSEEATAHFGAGVCEPDEAVLVAATAGPTDIAACDRDLVESAVEASGGRPLDVTLAETWWRRRTGQEETASPLPSLQVSATPGKQVDVYRAVIRAAKDAGVFPRSHASRFDVDGGVLFFTFVDVTGARITGSDGENARAIAEQAARRAGAFLLGAWNDSLHPYFEELRRQLDPNGILNPEVLRRLL
jgi:alkyldihydroxyacetonephosphate synthase